MAQRRVSNELFKRVIKRRDENTKSLEKKDKGSFKVKRFTPLSDQMEKEADDEA